jgi:hypothetical protein
VVRAIQAQLALPSLVGYPPGAPLVPNPPACREPLKIMDLMDNLLTFLPTSSVPLDPQVAADLQARAAVTPFFRMPLAEGRAAPGTNWQASRPGQQGMNGVLRQEATLWRRHGTVEREPIDSAEVIFCSAATLSRNVR